MKYFKNKNELIGKRVYCGGELNGIWGTVDKIEYDDDWEEDAYYIKDEEDNSIYKYALCELKVPVTITILESLIDDE